MRFHYLMKNYLNFAKDKLLINLPKKVKDMIKISNSTLKDASVYVQQEMPEENIRPNDGHVIPFKWLNPVDKNHEDIIEIQDIIAEEKGDNYL